LEEGLAAPVGLILQRAAQIDDALQLGFHLTLGDVTAEEFVALCILREERLKRQGEEVKGR